MDLQILHNKGRRKEVLTDIFLIYEKLRQRQAQEL